ncbi:glycosyltransferase [Leucobacter sp. 1207-22]|uniref:glycosyltransferase n=1 Tax=Leucobacter sp. 1207-22 TaxID=2604456 RepID=UPI0040641B27
MRPWTSCRVSSDFVYAGTASEWHGASVFVTAMPTVVQSFPNARLRFIGGGSERDALIELSQRLGVAENVLFEPSRSPGDLEPVLQEACATVGSVRPAVGYDLAFPSKLYSAAVCGAPRIFAGVGPARALLEQKVADLPNGGSVSFDSEEVANAMMRALQTPVSIERCTAVSAWAQKMCHYAL